MLGESSSTVIFLVGQGADLVVVASGEPGGGGKVLSQRFARSGATVAPLGEPEVAGDLLFQASGRGTFRIPVKASAKPRSILVRLFLESPGDEVANRVGVIELVHIEPPVLDVGSKISVASTVDEAAGLVAVFRELGLEASLVSGPPTGAWRGVHFGTLFPENLDREQGQGQVVWQVPESRAIVGGDAMTSAREPSLLTKNAQGGAVLLAGIPDARSFQTNPGYRFLLARLLQLSVPEPPAKP